MCSAEVTPLLNWQAWDWEIFFTVREITAAGIQTILFSDNLQLFAESTNKEKDRTNKRSHCLSKLG